MRVLVAGLGAVGQRHARNVRALLGDSLDLHALRRSRDAAVITPSLERDPSRDVERELDCAVHVSIDAALDAGPDAVIVATPSAQHLEIATRAADAGCAVYVEKPLAHEWYGVRRLLETARARGTVGMVGCQWRFHPAVALIRRALDRRELGPLLHAQLRFGEWLPGWHPYEDHRASYAARADLGGGVTLTQIHDYDLAHFFFGSAMAVQAVGGARSSLALEVDDVMDVLCEHRTADGPLTVHLAQNMAQRPGERAIRVVGENGWLEADLLKGIVRAQRADGLRIKHDFRPYERNTMFLEALGHFLSCVGTGTRTDVPLETGAAVLRTALAARRAATTGQRIELDDEVTPWP